MGKKIIARVAIIAMGILLIGAPVLAQAEDKSDDHMQQVRDQIKADKKQFITDNMQLTEKEAKAFWPVYESFQKDLDQQNKKFAGLIEDYAKNYETMDDQKAFVLINNYLAIETGRAYLIKSYIPKLKKTIGLVKAMRYLQLENKINTLVRLELAANIPLAK